MVDNVREHGTGPINVDGCRVGTDWNEPDRPDSWKRSGHTAQPGADKIAAPPGNGITLDPGGRWPPNVLLAHSDGCTKIGTRKEQIPTFDSSQSGRWLERGDMTVKRNGGHRDVDVDVYQCAPGCPVAELDRQSGRSKSTKGKPRASTAPGNGYGMTHTGAEYDDQGGCSRYFPCFYQSKASRSEREAGLEAFPLCTGGEATDRVDGSAGLQSPRAGAGRNGGRRNDHPTVKPIDLMRWLVRLVCPPGALVLDPFVGSGTTGIACALEGFDFIGYDRDPHAVDLARARIAHHAPTGLHRAGHHPEAGTPDGGKPA
jgi:hypothetical protein